MKLREFFCENLDENGKCFVDGIKFEKNLINFIFIGILTNEL